ncbi:MAG: hypothetical protein PVI52_05360 [Chromatiales bacterium]|jgi:hypothetical protein
MEPYVKTGLRLFVLLKPFLLGIYPGELMREADTGLFSRITLRGGLVSSGLFGLTGELIFAQVLQASGGTAG